MRWKELLQSASTWGHKMKPIWICASLWIEHIRSTLRYTADNLSEASSKNKSLLLHRNYVIVQLVFIILPFLMELKFGWINFSRERNLVLGFKFLIAGICSHDLSFVDFWSQKFCSNLFWSEKYSNPPNIFITHFRKNLIDRSLAAR